MFERRLITKLVKQWKVENRLAVVASAKTYLSAPPDCL
jgi:hypothetical protein